jgi:hypothetical protein
MARSEPSNASLAASTSDLQARFGLIVSGRELVRLMGYRTSAAFRQAVHRQSFGIQTFFVRGRRGRCASTADVARWAFELRATSEEERMRQHQPPR